MTSDPPQKPKKNRSKNRPIWEGSERYSERIGSGKNLLGSEKRYDALVEIITEGVVEVDAQWHMVFVNRRFAEMLGFRREDLEGRLFFDLVSDGYLQRAKEQLRRRGRKEFGAYELELVRADGETLFVLCSPSPHYADDGEYLGGVGVVTDITERRRVEAALKTAMRQWEKTFDAISDWVCLIDRHRRILKSNSRISDFVPFSAREAIGRRCADLLHDAAGVPLPVPCPFDEARLSRKRETAEIILADGRWCQIIVDPILLENTRDVSAVHIVRDITPLKRQENENIASKKVKAFSILSGGLAHDFNNLLSVIWGNLSLLGEEFNQQAAVDYLVEAEKACLQAKGLIRKLMMLSEGAVPKKSVADLSKLLRGTVSQVSKSVDIDISVECVEEIRDVAFDRAMLEIVFRNLIENAAEAMPHGGELDIRMENTDRLRSGRLPLPGVSVSFADNGPGLTVEYVDQIFDPYFTTKSLGVRKGMGLGLAVVQSVVIKHGGTVHVKTDPGRGTTVTIWFPEASFVMHPGTEAAVMRPSEKRKVLLLEDEPSLNKLCRQMLEKLGFEVVATFSAGEALDAYRRAVENRIGLDLALLDQNVKGGIGGVETLRRLRLLDPTLKAILVTGSPTSPVISDHRKYGFNGKLLKPYSKKDIAAAVERLLTS